VDLEEEKDKYH
jgi:hypothetical protein